MRSPAIFGSWDVRFCARFRHGQHRRLLHHVDSPLRQSPQGLRHLKHKSANTLENLRPGFFFDAILVRGLDPDDRYSVTSETFMVEDAAKKHLYSVPEYVLRITRYKAGTQEEAPVRVVYFHRDDLMPYQQDIYDTTATSRPKSPTRAIRISKATNIPRS